MRPQTGGHPVAALQFQRAKLGRLGDGGLPERGEFGPDIGVGRVDVDAELSGDLAVGGASLPQFEREDATLGDGLELAGASSTGWSLRVCAVALTGAGQAEAEQRQQGFVVVA